MTQKQLDLLVEDIRELMIYDDMWEAMSLAQYLADKYNLEIESDLRTLVENH